MVDLFEKLNISSGNYLGKNLQIQPGDLSIELPDGNGVYGFKKKCFDPIKIPPMQESSGGFVYFDNRVKKEDFSSFLRMMNVGNDNKEYAVFIRESVDPLKDGYFRQMRLVSKFGLRFMFEALDKKEFDNFKGQDLSLGDALYGFIEDERSRLGISFGDPRLEGKFGGDGNFAREELNFGFMVENDYHNIYRIWSRAWLVTK